LTFYIKTVLFSCLTHRFQDFPVLNDIVEVLGRRDNTCCTTIIRPQAVPIRHLLPLITVCVMRVNLVPVNFWKILCGFIESV
jgi:hypothetical protein